MAGKKKESFFWTSYSDLMTSLFLVMLTLFILAIAMLHKEVVKIGKERDATRRERDATQQEIEKINEIRTAIETIDTTYFRYDPEYKKHILKTKIRFGARSADIRDLSPATRDTLIHVRNSIRNFLEDLVERDNNVSYILVIEGQASRDSYVANNQLSYERALALYMLWFPENRATLKFYDLPCEIVIAGAGCMDGKPRAADNGANQRFLIQIMPKPGIIESDRK